MRMITIKHYGKIYGYCYVNENNINLGSDSFILGTDRFATDKRMNTKMLSSKYKASNHLDNEKFLSKGKRLVL